VYHSGGTASSLAEENMTRMPRDLEARLRRGARDLGVPLSGEIVEALSRLLELLQLWNRKLNLTAVKDPGAVIDRHVVDSLAVVPHVPEAAGSLVDIGSGAGFPGAVIALLRPGLAVSLVESVHKKAAFLEALRREVPLPNVRVFAERAEAWALRGDLADVAVSRAVWDVSEWLVRAVAWVNPGGLILAMEGSELHPLPPTATRHPYPHPQGRRAIIVQPRP
jgi:16S rRNA (guanine527-N7)-methyltransferase